MAALSPSPPPMKHNRALIMLDVATAGGYGVPAMCCYNVEGILASIRAAEAKQSPVMILLFPWALEYAGSHLVRLAASAGRAAGVPVTVHLDHAQSAATVRSAADIPSPDGFDSIMVDMSHHERDENLRLTAELTEYCHARGIAVEAEPGRIEGGEDGVADTADLESLLTTPDEALDFVATGIDWLAPAFGNVHGSYGPRGVRLEYDRLDGINGAVAGKGTRLVLHGSDTFTEEIFRRCISHGISKVNINKAMNREYTRVQAELAGKAPITKVIEEGTAAMQAVVESIIDMLGSTGKAGEVKSAIWEKCSS